MKNILLPIALLIASYSLAQDFKKVVNAAFVNQYELANTELIKIMADPKAQAKPDGWFWKTKIYAAFYKDDKFKSKYPDAASIADEAYTKYISLDPSLKILKDNNGQDALFNLYYTAFNTGITTFGAKDWQGAFNNFAFAVKYIDVIYQNKFSTDQKAAFDTTSILYAGFAAQNAQKGSEAVKYYKRLIDAKIGGPSYIDVYRFPLINATNQKNATEFAEYLALAKAMYPSEDWEVYESNYFAKSYSLAEKTQMYAQEDATDTMTAKRYQQYGDIFANVSKDSKETLDSTQLDLYTHKAADAFRKASLKNPTDGILAYNAGITYYNIYRILDDKVSSCKRALQELNTNRVAEKDPKKKTVADAKFKEQSDALKNQRIELDKAAAVNADTSVEFLEKAYTILKDKSDRTNVEKNCLNKTVDFIYNIYTYKRDKAKGKDPKAYDVYDAKFKTYDALHGKF